MIRFLDGKKVSAPLWWKNADHFLKFLQPACSGILPGYRYCVAIPGTPTSGPTTGIPSPLQPGTISSCKDFYLVKSGDICLTIERQFNLNDEQFWAWNTGVKRDCTNLYAGNYICVRA